MCPGLLEGDKEVSSDSQLLESRPAVSREEWGLGWVEPNATGWLCTTELLARELLLFKSKASLPIGQAASGWTCSSV